MNDQRILDSINSVVDDYSTGDTKAPRILPGTYRLVAVSEGTDD